MSFPPVVTLVFLRKRNQIKKVFAILQKKKKIFKCDQFNQAWNTNWKPNENIGIGRNFLRHLSSSTFSIQSRKLALGLGFRQRRKNNFLSLRCGLRRDFSARRGSRPHLVVLQHCLHIDNTLAEYTIDCRVFGQWLFRNCPPPSGSLLSSLPKQIPNLFGGVGLTIKGGDVCTPTENRNNVSYCRQ